jgi:hypothetical protein
MSHNYGLFYYFLIVKYKIEHSSPAKCKVILNLPVQPQPHFGEHNDVTLILSQILKLIISYKNNFYLE